MDSKNTALKIFNDLNNERIEGDESPLQAMYIALITVGEDTEDWLTAGVFTHAVDRAPRNEDDGIIPALKDSLDTAMAIWDSVQGEILTVHNTLGTVTVRSNVLILRPKE